MPGQRNIGQKTFITRNHLPMGLSAQLLGNRGPIQDESASHIPFSQHFRSSKEEDDMHWYVDVIKKYAVFNGRARRQEYWMFFLVNLIIAFAFGVLSAIVTSIEANSNSGSTTLSTAVSCLSSLYSLALLLPGLGVSIRRLHDTGRSGWWLLISLIPLIGEIWLIILLAQDGQPGTNQYGPNPKEGAGTNAPVVTQ
jgi:uncharacterized membrane protein YhaH (DUF805 family)